MSRSVLVVDDDPAIRIMVHAILSRDGLEVDAVESGNQAIARLQEKPYAAVVLDVMMRDGSGHDVLQTLASLRPDQKCVVVISATSPANLEKVDPANVVAKLRKPFDIHEMRAAIHRCVSGVHGTAT